MLAALSLRDCQERFMAALYAPDAPGPVEAIAGHGLDPAARLRIYRHSAEAAQLDALRTSYPAVLALVGAAFFEQCARGYRRAYPSHSGNLQVFGARLGDYLATLPSVHGVPYVPDVAQLEWLRQRAVLAGDATALGDHAIERALACPEGTLTLHPSVQRLASAYAVLTLFRYAMEPGEGGLQLPDAGENVLLWRDAGEVAMAALDAASFACIDALARGGTAARAVAAARGHDPDFDLPACVGSLARHGLIVGCGPDRGAGGTEPCH